MTDDTDTSENAEDALYRQIIRAEIDRQGLSVKGLADRAGISESGLRDILSGKVVSTTADNRLFPGIAIRTIIADRSYPGRA